MVSAISDALAPQLRQCWSYQRTSTARQAQADKSGMDRQEEALAAWLRDHPEYQLAEALVDAGVSAGTGRHRTKGALAQFIAAGKAKTIPAGSVLVVESVSRFSREASTDALMSLLGDVLQPGLAIAFTGFDSGRVITAERWNKEPGLKYGLIAALDSARTEWEERSARSRGGARKRERLQNEGEKVAAATPWWIQRDPVSRQLIRDESGNFVIDPVDLATINRAVELACAGMGTTLIAKVLDDEGRPPPQTANRRNQYRDKAAKGWTVSRVGYLLRHPALVGDLVRRDGRTIPGFYPPVLSLQRWHEVRDALRSRYKLRGVLRGGGQKTHNLFMCLTRCGVCGGTFSYHPSSERARTGHPGYMACRAANRRDNPTCSNSGYLNHGEVESHCLTRLTGSVWAELLGVPGQQEEIHGLKEKVNRLAHERRELEAQLTRAEERLQDLWASEASELKQEMAEAAVAKLRNRFASAKADHDAADLELQALMAKPTGEQAAAELQARVHEFWQQLDAGEVPAEERRAFNRWLRARRPSIQFLFHPQPEGQPQSERMIELRVDGRSAGIESLAGVARRTARDQGMVAPTLAVQVPLGSDGDTLVHLEGNGIKQTLQRLKDGRIIDNTTTFAVWHANKPLQPAISHLLKLLPARLQEMGITNLDDQQQMRLAILLAQTAAKEASRRAVATVE